VTVFVSFDDTTLLWAVNNADFPITHLNSAMGSKVDVEVKQNQGSFANKHPGWTKFGWLRAAQVPKIKIPLPKFCTTTRKIYVPIFVDIGPAISKP